mgnify:CR=1 FL=1|jgi:hypothetical protein|tara:strand:+ start:30 stop:380 length:351 start_codon:yes stop_codon:yes gene_type:complete
MKLNNTKRPSTVKVLGLLYTLKWVDSCSGGDCLGWCDNNDLTITIVTQQPDTALANVFLHEVIHAINCSMNIEGVDEEKLTNRLANGLCSVWVDNPQVWNWWSKLLKKKPPTRKKA